MLSRQAWYLEETLRVDTVFFLLSSQQVCSHFPSPRAQAVQALPGPFPLPHPPRENKIVHSLASLSSLSSLNWWWGRKYICRIQIKLWTVMPPTTEYTYIHIIHNNVSRLLSHCYNLQNTDYNILWKHKILFFNCHASNFVYMVKETWQFGHKIVFTLNKKM